MQDLIGILPRALQYYQQGIQEAWRSSSENRSCSGPAEWNHGSLSQATFLLANGHVQMVIALLSALMLWISRGRGGRANALQSINQSARLGPRFAQWIEANEEKLHTLLASRPRQGGGGAGRVAESATKKAAKGGKDGGKVKARKQMKQHDVKCFRKNAKGDPAEYERQLRDQERGLNNLSVKEYLEGRARFKEIGRKGTGAEQAKARAKYSKELTKKFKDQLAEQGVVGAEAQKRATAMAADKMNTLAALHNPDMIAGGKDVVTAMGDKGVNSSIGSQWKGRVAELDEAAKGIPEAERGGTMMNAKLKRCK